MYTMRKVCLSFAIYILSGSYFGVSAKQTLEFAVNSPGSKPYIYFDASSKQYHGVAIDVLNRLSLTHDINVIIVDSHRTRIEAFIYDGKVDATLTSDKWLKHPEKLISTVPLLEHKSYLYSLSPITNEVKFDSKPTIKICTRSGFTYPTLDNLFSSKLLERVDSSDQNSMFNMLRKNRCNFTIMNEHNANAIYSEKDRKALGIYQSPKPRNVVNVAIFLRPELREIKSRLDLVIKTMLSQGLISESLAKHSQNTQSN